MSRKNRKHIIIIIEGNEQNKEKVARFFVCRKFNGNSIRNIVEGRNEYPF